MKRILFILLLIVSFQSKALYYISDPGFRKYLQYEYSSCMIGDFLDESCASLQSGTLFVYTSSISGGEAILDIDGLQFFTGIITIPYKQLRDAIV